VYFFILILWSPVLFYAYSISRVGVVTFQLISSHKWLTATILDSVSEDVQIEPQVKWMGGLNDGSLASHYFHVGDFL
jgi:hypothetical protein